MEHEGTNGKLRTATLARWPQQVALEFKVEVCREFAVRRWLAMWLIGLAGMVLGAEVVGVQFVVRQRQDG